MICVKFASLLACFRASVLDRLANRDGTIRLNIMQIERTRLACNFRSASLRLLTGFSEDA